MNDKAIRAAAKEIERHKMEPWTDTKAVEIARDAIAAYEAAMWRPIEEAPEASECVEILVYGGRYERPTMKLSDGSWWRSQKGKLAGIPTVFRSIPLPATPESEDAPND